MRARWHVAGIAGLAGVAVLVELGGCGTFDDPSTVKDLRVLAVAAEPSEVILDVTDAASAAAASIPPLTLTPLVVDPAARPVSVTVSACANDPSAPTSPNAVTDPTGYPAGGIRTTVGSALCDGAPTAIPLATGIDLAASPSIDVALDPAWVAAAFARDVFAGADGVPHGGFDLGMPVVFQLTASAGGDTVRAIKRAIFWTHAVRDDQRANTTPVIPGVRMYARRDETTAEPLPDAVQALEAGTPADVTPDGVWIDPVAASDPSTTALAESYVTTTLDRVTGQLGTIDVKETLTYSFYASAGTFSPLQTRSEPPPGVVPRGRVHIESKYHPPKDMTSQPPGAAATAPLDVTIWIVVRDERGGASWVTRPLRVPAPAAQ